MCCAECPGHEVLYIAAADNIGGRDLAAAIKAQFGDAMEVSHPHPILIILTQSS